MNDEAFMLVISEQLQLINARMIGANESERRALEKARDELLAALEIKKC